MITWCWRIVHRIQQWSEAYAEQQAEQRARAIRHLYAPQLEAYREIAQVPDARPKKVVHLNLLIVRGQRTTGRRIAS